MKNLTIAELSQMRRVAVKAAEAAGLLLMRSYGRLQQKQVARKGISDYVTDLDHAAERIVIKTIRKYYPDHGFKAEESGQSSSESLFEWVIDPVDGTTNYIHQFPIFCTSIGLCYKGKPVVGVIHDPLKKELFHATKGGGAWLNRKRIRVAKRPGLRDALIATGFPFRIRGRFGPYMRSFKEVFFHCSGIRRAGSAAIDLAYTAAGRIDGFWEMGLKPWDIAAGTIIIQEAGGVVSDFAGGDRYLEHGSIVAGNPRIQKGLVRILKKIFPSGK